MNSLKHSILIAIILLSINLGFGQNYSLNSIKIGVGIGVNEGVKETGVGIPISIGFQKSLWKDRSHLCPHLVTSNFKPLFITDTRDQYYRVTILGLNGYLDLLKKESAALYVGSGLFVNYTRGLLGTGGFPEAGNNQSEYFRKFYYGGFLGCGLKITPRNSRVNYDIAPLNAYIGSNHYLLLFFQFGIEIKLNAKSQ